MTYGRWILQVLPLSVLLQDIEALLMLVRVLMNTDDLYQLQYDLRFIHRIDKINHRSYLLKKSRLNDTPCLIINVCVFVL